MMVTGGISLSSCGCRSSRPSPLHYLHFHGNARRVPCSVSSLTGLQWQRRSQPGLAPRSCIQSLSQPFPPRCCGGSPWHSPSPACTGASPWAQPVAPNAACAVLACLPAAAGVERILPSLFVPFLFASHLGLFDALGHFCKRLEGSVWSSSRQPVRSRALERASRGREASLTPQSSFCPRTHPSPEPRSSRGLH